MKNSASPLPGLYTWFIRLGLSPWLTARERADLTADVEELRHAYRRTLGSRGLSRYTWRQLLQYPIRLTANQGDRSTMDSVWQDCRYAARMLIKNPGFTGIAVLVLAVGIGANTATFTLMNALLLKPIVAEAPHELVALYSKNLKLPDSFRPISYPNFEDIRELNTTFSDVLAHDLRTAGLREGDVTNRVFAEIVSHNYFDTFGVAPFRGRFFTPAEEVPDSNEPVVVVSYEFWRQRGEDPDLVGKSINVGGQDLTVIGITPRYFTGRIAILSASVYVPLGMERLVSGFGGSTGSSLAERNNHRLFLVGRLLPGVSMEDADARLAALASRMEESFPEINESQTIIVGPLSRLGISTEPSDGDGLGLVAALMLGMTGIVLLIACINLANMLLARGAARRREFAVRAAIGGGRLRILRQLLTEGLFLSLLGGAAGLVVATWANGLLAASLGEVLSNLGFTMDIVLRTEPDLRVLLATAGFCMLGTLAFGLGPAWQQSRPDVMAAIKEQTGDASGQGRGGPLGRRNLLVVSQIALSLVMLISAGLFVRASLKAANIDPGFRLDNGILVEVDTSLVGYDDAQSKDTYRRLSERLQSIPGVQAMSVAATVPFGAVSSGRDVRRAEDQPTTGGDGSEEIETVRARSNIIGAQYFEALDLPVLRGRAFTATETASDAGPKVAIIDELLAESLWPGQDPIGRFIGLGRVRDPEGGDEIEVVGLVPSISEDIFPAERRPHVYRPFGQNFQAAMNIHVRADSITDDDARAAMLQTIRREIRAVDGRLPIISLRALEDHIAESASLWLVRLGATIFSIFGALALFLAVIGVYGVKAYAVARRTREIGIRKALGATTSDTLRLILRESMLVAAAGLGVGLVLGAGVASLLASLLYEVSPYDPVAFLASTAVLALAAFVATYLPAQRAASVTPVTALRAD